MTSLYGKPRELELFDDMIQRHPLFAELLRHQLEDYYSVETNVPVGDLPREADIVLLCRTAGTTPPFRSIWKQLTNWNVLEFKGPTDAALRDLDPLFEVGLGIDRRLNEHRTCAGLPTLERVHLFGNCEQFGAGLWRCRAAGHPLFLVSRDTLPVDAETVPLHLVCGEPERRGRPRHATGQHDPRTKDRLR